MVGGTLQVLRPMNMKSSARLGFWPYPRELFRLTSN